MVVTVNEFWLSWLCYYQSLPPEINMITTLAELLTGICASVSRGLVVQQRNILGQKLWWKQMHIAVM